MKLFIDTNVILDLLAARKPFVKSAEKIFTLAANGRLKLFTSSISIATTYYILGKQLSPEDTRASLQKLLTLITVSDAGHMGTVRAVNDLNFKDIEDALQNQCALTCKAKIIVTRNEKDFRDCSLSVMTPDQFLSRTSLNF